MIGSSFHLFSQVYHFENYNVHNGLGQSQVSDIIQDRFGYIWLSTRGGGLSRFDGIHFKTYRKEDGLPANNISSLKLDKQCRLLIGTYRGFCVFDGKKFRNLLPQNRTPRPMRAVFSDSRNEIYLLFGKNGIGKFQGDSLVEIKRNDTTKSPIMNLQFDSKSRIYVSDYQGVSLFEKGVLKPSLLLPNGQDLYGFSIDKQNRIWLVSSKGVFLVRKINDNITKNNFEKIGDFNPRYFLQTTRGDMWIGLMEGVLRIEKNGKRTIFNKKNGFTNAQITKIFEDKEGVIWFAADGDGLYKFTDSPFTSINSDLGLSDNSVGSILVENDNKIWFGSFSAGVSRWESGKIVEKIDKSNGLICDVTTAGAIDSKGNKWFSNGNCGFVKIDANRKITKFSSKLYGEEYISSIIVGENDEIWLSTWGGIVLFDGKKMRRFGESEGLKNHRISQILKIGKNEFVAFSNVGAYRIKDYKIEPFEALGTWENSRVNCSFFDEKSQRIFWGDMEEGIFVFDQKTKKKYQFTTKNGLSSNLIYNLIFDKEGFLWVGSEKGLDRIEFDKNLKINDISYYSKGEGFTGVETNAMSVALDKSGHLWIGTIAGAFRYDSEKDTPSNSSLETRLTDVRLLFDSTNVEKFGKHSDSWHNVYEKLELPFQKNNLSFSFLSIFHRNPQSVVYQYKLEGFDENWSIPTPKNEAIYTNLPFGEYVFMVRASNNCGKWSDKITKYSFKISPPFYRTWWFSLLTMLGLLGAIFVTQNIYAKFQTRKALAYEKIKQEAESDVRKQVAQDFHDELGNRLAAITTQSSVLNMKLSASNNENQKIIKEIEENARKLYTDTKDFIWAIDPESNRMNEVLRYIKDFGERLFQYSEIEFEMKSEISELYENLHLPAGWSIQIIMIFKEAMTNALKHSGAKKVVFDYEITEFSKFYFGVSDDGKGMQNWEIGNKQKGISNMKQRAEKIDADLQMLDNQPTGLKVLVSGIIPNLKLKT